MQRSRSLGACKGGWCLTNWWSWQCGWSFTPDLGHRLKDTFPVPKTHTHTLTSMMRRHLLPFFLKQNPNKLVFLLFVSQTKSETTEKAYWCPTPFLLTFSLHLPLSLHVSLHVTLSCWFNLLVNDNEPLSVSVCLGHAGAPHNLAAFEVSVCVKRGLFGDRDHGGHHLPIPTHTPTHTGRDGIRAPLWWPLRQEEIKISVCVCVLVSMGVMDAWLKTLLTLRSPAAEIL